ncbi:MAG: AI-2E family transporter [Acidimicrobiia bacterium]|nr:AI-2E family transporter [Acidimicrobiia bacterium]
MTSPPGDALRRIGLASWSLLGTILLLSVVVWGIIQVSNLIPAVVLAVAVIYVLNPVVSRLQGWGVPRLLGSCLSYIALLGVLVLVGFLAFPSIGDQARQLGDDFPEIYEDLASDAERWADNVGFSVDVPNYDELRDSIDEATNDGGVLSFNRLGDYTLGVLEFLLLLILAPVLAFYILLDLPKMREHARGLVPSQHREEAVFVSKQLGTAIGGFLRGQLLVALIVGVMTSVGFWAVGLEFWLLIGMIAGFLNIIPFVGPWVGGGLGVLVALATADPQTALWAAIVAAGVQQVDNHFISPNVLRFTVRLHPATIILVLLVGGTLGGLLGVLLAVPVMASIKIISGHMWRTRVLGESWEEASEALIEEHPTGEMPLIKMRNVADSDGAQADEMEDK